MPTGTHIKDSEDIHSNNSSKKYLDAKDDVCLCERYLVSARNSQCHFASSLVFDRTNGHIT